VSVYVDDFYSPFGRMLMCHMLADSAEELHAMADTIGVQRKWFQADHYDVCKSKRALAVRAGAVEVTSREIIEVRRRWRKRYGMKPSASEILADFLEKEEHEEGGLRVVGFVRSVGSSAGSGRGRHAELPRPERLPDHPGDPDSEKA